MAGEFLPPVVTYLKGDISDVVDKVNEVRALIKSLGSLKVTIPVNFDVNQASLNRAMANAKTQAKSGVTAPVNFEADAGSLARTMAGAQAVASVGINVPVRFVSDTGGGIWDYGTMRAIAASRQLAAITASAERLAIGPGPGPVYGPRNAFAMGGGASRVWPMGNGTGPDSFTWNPTQYPWATNNGGSRGFWPAAALSAWSNWSRTGWRAGGNGTTPGWWGWAGGVPWGAVHAGVYSGIGLLAALAGGTIDLGALSAVWGSGIGQVGSIANRMNTAVSATIPPGVPDYALARAFGVNVNPNSAMARAQLVGTGQVYGAYGGIVNLINSLAGKGGFISNLGLNEGSNLDSLIARMDTRAASSTGAFAKFATLTTEDAANVGKGFTNILSVIGHIVAHAPGEIEWITSGFRNVTGWANDLFTNPILKQITGPAVWGTLLTHFVGEIMKYGSKGLMKILPEGMVAEDGILAGLAGSSTLGLFTNPYVLGAAAVAGGALLGYRYQTPQSAQVRQWESGLNGVLAGRYALDVASNIGSAFNLLPTSSRGTSILGILTGAEPGGSYLPGFMKPAVPGFLQRIYGWMNNVGTLGFDHKEQSPYQSYVNALNSFQSGFIQSGNTWNSLASALGITPAQAATMANLAGVKMNANGTPQGGMKQAVLMMLNYRSALGILNGKQGETMANMGVLNMVNDSAWKDASTINSAWDSFMAAMTGGGTNLQGIYSALHKTPGGSLTSLFSTGSAITSAGEPMLDWFRQAQAAGAVSGGAISKDFALVAASLSPLAGRSKTAQADLLALANEGGGHFTSMAQLMKAAGGSASAALKELDKSVNGTTLSMAKLPPFAQQMATAVQTNVDAMAESIVAKNQNAKSAFDNLISTMERFPGNAAKLNSAANQLAGALEKDHMNAGEVAQILQQLGFQGWGASKGLDAAARAWSLIHPGTKTLTTIFDTYYTHGGSYGGGPTGATRAPRKSAFGVRDSAAGWSWVGENGPELKYLPAGTSIIPNHYIGQALSGMGGMGSGEIHNHIYLDGKELFNVVKKQTYGYNVNNGNRGTGGRVAGTMVPR